MDETRDAELGRQLEAVIEPDHGPEYWRDVRLQVAKASAEAQRSGLGRRLRAAVAPRRVRLALAAAALIAAATVAVLVGVPRAPGPQTVNAAHVLDRALAAYSSGHTWQADLVGKFFRGEMWETSHPYVFRRFHMMRDADGSFRWTAFGGTAPGSRMTGIETYDARTGVLRGGEPGRSWHVVAQYPLGPPDTETSLLLGVDVSANGVDFGATLRAVAASGTHRLDETVVDGRPAWTVTCTKGEMAGLPSSNVDWPVYTITVDKQTWLPVRFQDVTGGFLIADVRFRNVRIDEPLPRRAFTARPSPGLTVRRSDRGFRRVTLDEAVTAPGVTPLVPGFLPGGYELSRVAVAPHSLTGNHVVRARHVFELQYTSGFDALMVSTRRIHDMYYTADDDPLDDRADPTWSKLARTEATIASGAFAGATARIVVATMSSKPHLWAVKDGVLLTIAGGATAKELLAIAESLQAYPGPSASPAGQTPAAD